MNFFRIRLLPCLSALALCGCMAQAPQSNTAPSNLPPDPGDAGKTTLQGIDTDGDGLRDDVQRHIYTDYADAPTQKVLVKLAKSYQDMLSSNASKTLASSAAQKMNDAVDCIFAADSNKIVDRVEEIEGQVINTGSRATAYAQTNALLSGEAFSAAKSTSNNCGD